MVPFWFGSLVGVAPWVAMGLNIPTLLTWQVFLVSLIE
ncbi:hypothetical protein ARTHRO8AJ_440055 [Arthrobacter sp. 8AJ]|nr:hypothetical protein ARTHRO8AJ_440055 [Arthrobacter sp. 8AJ]